MKTGVIVKVGEDGNYNENGQWEVELNGEYLFNYTAISWEFGIVKPVSGITTWSIYVDEVNKKRLVKLIQNAGVINPTNEV